MEITVLDYACSPIGDRFGPPVRDRNERLLFQASHLYELQDTAAEVLVPVDESPFVGRILYLFLSRQ